MPQISRRLFVLISCSVLSFLASVQTVDAATLSTLSDTVSTSRPSASAPLAADQAAGASSVQIRDNNSFFLASDSATLRPDTGETSNTVTVASFSAADTPSAGRRTITFTGTAANAHHAGSVIVVPVTAVHTISFQTIQAIPTSGNIKVKFPTLTSGDANNPASPSATTFQFNGLGSGLFRVYAGGVDITSNVTLTVTNPTSGNQGELTFTLDGSTSINASTTVKLFIGCSAASSTACTTPAPRIINPTKTFAYQAGTSRPWTIQVVTRDVNGGQDLDTGSTTVFNVEAVRVQANVEQTLSFSIAGLAAGTNLKTQNTNCGSSGDVLNSTISSTPTLVDLGSLSNGTITKAAQEITISTNSANGYALTATSSGRFLNPANGYWITDANGGNGMTANDTPAPAVFGSSGTPAFGIHACGANVTAQWVGGSDTAFGSGARYMNPWNSGTNAYIANLSSYASPITNDKVIVEYAATISGSTPAGTYATNFTYVATPIF